MNSTNYTVGSSGMIMRSGCDTSYAVSGSIIQKSGCSTNLTVNNDGEIVKGGSPTGYYIRSGTIMKGDYDKGHNIDWLFN